MVLGLATAAGAQDLRVSGMVAVTRDARPMPLAGAWVSLHAMSATGGRVVDSVRTGADGRFGLRTAGTAAAQYVVGVAHGGVVYFSDPFSPPADGDTALAAIVVYDTSSTEPIAVAERTIAVSTPGDDGARVVADEVVLYNGGERTRVAPPKGTAWAVALAVGAVEPVLGESDLPPTAVELAHGEARILAPIAPGRRRVSVLYTLPATARVLDIPLAAGAERVSLALADSTLRVDDPRFRLAAVEPVGAVLARRFEARDLPPQSRILVPLPPHDEEAGFLWIVVLGALAAMVAALAWRRATGAARRHSVS